MTCDMWHVTCAIWHGTCDMQHVTCDMLRGMNILSKFQLPSSSGLWIMIFWRLWGKGWLIDLMSDEADCRTAPATPGLLNIGMPFIYDTLMTCAPVLVDEQIQFPWRVVFGNFCSNWFKMVSANPANSQTLNQKRKLLLLFSRLMGWKLVWPWSLPLLKDTQRHLCG